MRKMKSAKFIGVLTVALALAYSPIAVADSSDNGAMGSEGNNSSKTFQSDGNSVSNPEFDSHGNTASKIYKSIRGDSPYGVPNYAQARTPGVTSNGINYHAGAVMNGSAGTKVNLVWYGTTWTDAQKTIIKTMINGLNGSPYFNINTTYYGAGNVAIKNIVSVGTETSTGYTLGKNLSDANILSLAQTNLGDVNTMTLVLTDGAVSESSGFLTKYCGWHTWTGNSKYGFIGNPLSSTACSAQSKSPNGDAGVDAMASVIAHEIEETVTDPLGNGWFDSRGYENGDKCAWKFGTTLAGPNGSTYNVTLGGSKYLIQQNWVNASGGFCSISR